MTTPSPPPKSPPRASVIPSFDNICNGDERKLARLEPAWGKVALFFRTAQRLGHHDSIRCMSLFDVHRLLEVYRGRFAAGDTLSLLQAVGTCADENLPLPTWLADAFRDRMTAFLGPGRFLSLDEVFFSVALPTSSTKKAASVRQDWQLAIRLCHDAWELAYKDDTLTSFDRVVESLLKTDDYGVRKTKAKQLITMIDTSQSQFLEKKHRYRGF